MSKEYIEKKAFVTEIKERQEEVRRWERVASCRENQIRADAAMCVFAEIKQTLLAIPPADVKPVLRGEWRRGCAGGDAWADCSCCGNYVRLTCECVTLFDSLNGLPNFCPNCGAEMRVRNDEEV